MKFFAVEVEGGKDGRDGKPAVGPVYRNLLAKNDFPPPDFNFSNSWDIFRTSVEKYPRNRMLGWREFNNGNVGPYVWKTYKEVYDEVLVIGSALRAMGAEPGSRIGIYGSNCPQWIMAMEACNAHSLICVPLYDNLAYYLNPKYQYSRNLGLDDDLIRAVHTVVEKLEPDADIQSRCIDEMKSFRDGNGSFGRLSATRGRDGANPGPGAVNFIIEHAEIDFVFVQDKKVKELLNSDCRCAQRLRLVVCFTSLTGEEKDDFSCIGLKPYSWKEFLEMGRENPAELSVPQPLTICTIMYTSGTSGDPKGVVLTHENMAMVVRSLDLFLEQFEDKMTVDDVYLSFLPLAHVLDRILEEYFFRKGASVGYFHGDIKALKDDLIELKPTFFAGVPRVFERVHEGAMKTIEALSPLKRKIFGILYRYKLAWMNLGYKQKDASPLADLLAFRKVKAGLGGRVRLVVSGGAPLSTELEEFLRVTTCAFVVQGYGLTETSGLATVGFPDEMSMLGAVGVPSVYSEIRLEEVPEMGYNPLGNPPCGEICVRGKTVFAGYHKDPDLTKESFRDGWFHTGDIGELLPNGALKIIDRKKNIFKLSQGEYVAVEYLEKVYSSAPIVDDVWVYGDSTKSMLVAVVIPNEDYTKKWAGLNGHRGSFSELCSLDQLRNYILLELKTVAKRNKLRGFEYIKGVIVDHEPFEFQKDLVTPTMKKRRNLLLKCYLVEIDNLYQSLTSGVS